MCYDKPWMEIKNEHTVKEILNSKSVIKVGTFNCSETEIEYLADYFLTFIEYDKTKLVTVDGEFGDEDEDDLYVRFGMSEYNDWIMQNTLETKLSMWVDEEDDEDEGYKNCREVVFCCIALALMDTENNKTYDVFYNIKKDEYYFIFDGLDDKYYTVESIDALNSEYNSNLES